MKALKSYVRARWGGQVKAAEALSTSQSTVARILSDPHCASSRPHVEIGMGLPVLQIIMPPSRDAYLDIDSAMAARMQAACRRIELSAAMLWERSGGEAIPGAQAVKVAAMLEDAAGVFEAAVRELIETQQSRLR